ncbi:MAG: protocatechuate 3,4-dioxygenase subunit alpha [Jatrophihabitans sp.]
MSEHVATPGQTVGPFFGDALPYPRDHELVLPTDPRALRLHGTVFDGAGDPVPDALLEIRQADRSGVVPHREGSLRRDAAVFTGWGRCATAADGRYSFTTIAPGPIRAAAPFFAVAVFARGLLNRLFTRAYLPGSSDALLDSLPPGERATLIAERDGEHDLRFDVNLQGERQTVFLRYPRHPQ